MKTLRHAIVECAYQNAGGVEDKSNGVLAYVFLEEKRVG